MRINRLRREAGMTRADVALRLGVSKPTVWAREKGKARPLPERMAAIAEALGAAPEDLTEADSHNADTAALIAECCGRIAEVRHHASRCADHDRTVRSGSSRN